MAEYIEREHLARLLMEDIELFGEENSGTKPIAYGTAMGLKTALRYVNGVGAADVVEVRHGEWNDNIIGFCNVCMECGAIVERTAIKNKSGELNYCPNCGAKMDGKDGAK